MSLNNTPMADRVHIGIFGRRNAGKSSIINALTNQNLAIVSDVKGTTTDPVLKAMELLPLGPVVFIDTPGLDDTGTLGALRVQKACQMLNKTDIALLIVDSSIGVAKEDMDILNRIREKQIPYLIVCNKADLQTDEADARQKMEAVFKGALPADAVIFVSAKEHFHIEELKERIAALAPKEDDSRRIVGDLISPGDFVVLVIPIDKAAPKGRLILPQQQTIRDILDGGATAVAVRDRELAGTLKHLGKPPALVITDSQVFGPVSKIVPEDIPLTSFSILFARYKGSLRTFAAGAKALDSLKDGDKILISEGCTHHRQCEDIGTVKLPRLLKKHTGLEHLEFVFTSGTEFPTDLTPYKAVIHCGGCTLNEREMKYRQKCAEDAHVPMTNYGIAIAHMNGILARSLEPLQTLALHVPSYKELSYRQKLLSDTDTMSYNKGYDLDISGYHKDTGCIDFPELDWRDWYDRFIRQIPKRFYAYLVREPEGTYIGEVNLCKNPKHDWYDIGIVLESSYRGHGYSKIALELLLRYAFDELNIEVLHNAFDSARTAAVRTHLAAGFTQTQAENGITEFFLTRKDYFSRLNVCPEQP